ncbi:MAG: hypothetical protein QXI36_00060 [Candidatus Bathyarchaeia archaeon]
MCSSGGGGMLRALSDFTPVCCIGVACNSRKAAKLATAAIKTHSAKIIFLFRLPQV